MAPPEIATTSSSIEEIVPSMLAHTPMEKPSSTGSPIFCSYSTSSPSETSALAGFRKRPPSGMFTPLTSLTSETMRSEEHTSELQSRQYIVCRLLLEKKKHSTQQTVLYQYCLLPLHT